MLSSVLTCLVAIMMLFNMNQEALDSETTQAEVKDAIASCYGTSASNVTLNAGHSYSINLGGSSGTGSFNTEFRVGYGNYYLKVFKTGDSHPCSLTIVDEDLEGFKIAQG